MGRGEKEKGWISPTHRSRSAQFKHAFVGMPSLQSYASCESQRDSSLTQPPKKKNRLPSALQHRQKMARLWPVVILIFIMLRSPHEGVVALHFRVPKEGQSYDTSEMVFLFERAVGLCVDVCICASVRVCTSAHCTVTIVTGNI